tara:strand:- start:17624 stop:18262 length:639 start_codon:yes stop_codon:yes gene_type:complete
MAVLEALVRGLHQLAEDPTAIEEMVDRKDMLFNGTQLAWSKELRDDLVSMLDPQSANYVNCLLAYPTGIADLPTLSIVEESGGENEGEAVMGDLLHVFWTLVQPDDQSCRHDVRGIGETTRIQVGAWTTSPERSLLLRAAAHWALFQNKGLLQDRGIHEVSFSSGGVEVSDDLLPRVAYVPMISLTLKWTFRATKRSIVPNRVTICPGTFGT